MNTLQATIDATIRFAIQQLGRGQQIHFPLVHREWLIEIVDDLRDSGMDLWVSEDPAAGIFTVGEGW